MLLVLSNQRDLVDHERAKLFADGVKVSKLIFNVVVRKSAVALEEAIGQSADFGLEGWLVEDVEHPNTGTGSLGAVGGPDALAGGSDGVFSALGLVRWNNDIRGASLREWKINRFKRSDKRHTSCILSITV